MIPAPIRRQLALAAGTELDVEVEGDVIHLRPSGGASLERRGRVLVITSPLAGEVPDHRDIRDERTDLLIDEEG